MMFLKPGEYAIRVAKGKISTLLGSCVSVTLWHPERKVGAMSHFLLWSRGGPSHGKLDPKYGDEAIPLMLRDLVAEGVNPAECQAKLFGGASMFKEMQLDPRFRVGRQNGESARGFLSIAGIQIVAQSLYGEAHRKIVFVVDSGEVWARQGAEPPKKKQG